MKNLDETDMLSPNFNADGLIAAIAQDAQTKDVLMLAWMNHEALNKTIETGEAHYWSRSRQSLWHKGADSGAIQVIKEIRIDCDQDAILLMVEPQKTGACHTGRRSCFYRKIESSGNRNSKTLIFVE